MFYISTFSLILPTYWSMGTMPSLLAHESNRKRVSAYELWITFEIRDFEFFLTFSEEI